MSIIRHSSKGNDMTVTGHKATKKRVVKCISYFFFASWTKKERETKIYSLRKKLNLALFVVAHNYFLCTEQDHP